MTDTIPLTGDDVSVEIDRLIVGDGNLRFPVDIWHLPPLPGAPGPPHAVRGAVFANSFRIVAVASAHAGS